MHLSQMPKIKKEEVTTTNSNPLISALDKSTSYGTTENGALTHTDSGSALVNFFAQAGAKRKDIKSGLELFKRAFSEDNNAAIKILFYLRDVRGGQGERAIFRECLDWLSDEYPAVFTSILPFVQEYGRWDDIFFDNKEVYKLISQQLEVDRNAEFPSLLVKWLPKIDALSRTTRAKAKVIADGIGMPYIEYRKTTRDIRKKLNLVEQKMSANKWREIMFDTVPSQASRIYRNAFARHDSTRYDKYIEDVKSGKKKINASTLYPYQIYDSMEKASSVDIPTLNALWDNLPDYTCDKNAIVVADVSGSMWGEPMSVSVSLALYFAERNKGHFNGYFMTFSGNPTLQKVYGSDLKQKMEYIKRAEWGFSTNLQKVFDTILDNAVSSNVKEEDMPSTIYIVSDMEFDIATRGAGTNFDVIKMKYAEHGYKMPNLVFWNVNSRNNNLPVRADETNVTMVSGRSPSAFKLATENKTPYDVMMDIVNSERYAPIKI
jgi:hypothetical protein